MFASHHSSLRSTWAPGLTLYLRIHLNSKKEGEVSRPRSWGSQAGHCSGRRFCLRGKSSACVVAWVWQTCFADGKLRHTEVGQQGEGEHVFLEESLFLPPQEKGQVRGQPVAALPLPYVLPLTSSGSLWIQTMGLGKSCPRASLFLLPCLGGQCSCPANSPKALFVA